MQFINQLQRITLYIFFFFINFEMFEPLSTFHISISRFTGILYFLTIMPEIKFFVRTDRINNILLFAWVFFGLLTLVSLLNINEVSNEFLNTMIFQNILLFWFLINHARKDYLILEKGMLFFAFGAIIIALFYIAGIGVEYDVGGRLSMFKENQNSLGVKMNLGIIILFLAVIQDKLQIGRIRYLFLIPVPLLVDFLFATGSRISFTSFILCIVAGIVLLKTKKSIGKLVTIFTGIVGLIIIGTLVMQTPVLRDRLLQSAQEGDLSHRDVIWRNLLPLIKENPVFGVGQSGYNYYTLITFGGEKSPHNVILEVICLTGFVGLLIYLSFLYKVFQRAYQVYGKVGLLLPILLAIPILGLLLSGQILGQKVGWIIFAYMVGSTAIKKGSMKITCDKRSIENENPLCN